MPQAAEVDNWGGTDCTIRRYPRKDAIESNGLGHALSWRRNVLANERTLSLKYLCTAVNIDLRESVWTFTLFGRCYSLFVVTIHKPAVKVIRSLIVVLLVVQIS
jgi:hypothetical protein